MAGKGRGWHDDSRRHSLARKGIKTADGKIMKSYGIQCDSNGNVMVSKGLLKDLFDKARSSITESKIATKIKGVGTDIKQIQEEKQLRKSQKLSEKQVEQAKKTEAVRFQAEKKGEIKTLKEERKRLKRGDVELETEVKQVEKQRKRSQRQELEQASHFGKKPSRRNIDLDNKGRVGALKQKISSEERKVPKSQLMDLPKEAFQSPDADSIIAIAENSEKLIDYNNELKYDINMIKVEKRRLAKRFRSDEYKEFKDFKVDRQKARVDFERNKDSIKITGMDESDMKQKISKLQNEFKQEFNQREIELGALRNRNRVTLQFLDDLGKDLKRNVIKINKRIKVMTASGKVK